MLLSILFILLGFALLVKGGDFLVDGSVAIAQRARLTPIVIGITVVGFGTSMPEFLVSVQAALAGSSGIAIGNVAGSNIANVALILGVTSLIRPLPATRQMLRTDLPFMLLAMLLFIAAASYGTINRLMGIAMFSLLVGFISWEIHHSRKITARAVPSSVTSVPTSGHSSPSSSQVSSGLPAETASASSPSSSPMPLWRAILLVLISLAAMIWGADLLIKGSTDIAREVGQSLGVDPIALERIIGLTVIALGTSLPELFASVIAARKGQTDMAIGNIIGSITFNILSVVGVASAITPIPNTWAPFMIDYTIMLFLGILLYIFLITRRSLIRIHGSIFLLIYIAYTLYTSLHV